MVWLRKLEPTAMDPRHLVRAHPTLYVTDQVTNPSFDSLANPVTIVDLDRSVVPEPDLGETIQPTVFNIVIRECDRCLDVCSLAKSWITSLPYPDLLRRVTIDITASDAGSEIFFPQLADYEVLSRCLQQLRENGRLDVVDLTIAMRGWIDRDAIDATESRELAKLKMGFSALLDVDVLEIDFTMTCWHYQGFQPILLHHRIERLCTE
ncbi:hypothetical protein EYR38_007374 [Pleurotus pulmonarius]|nr:hypothetical protein EYR38_007374 [Pleurotus pulmonarius]